LGGKKLNITIDSSNSHQNILWFKKFPNGRFANSIFQFVFAKYAEQCLDCGLLIGELETKEIDHIEQLLSITNNPTTVLKIKDKVIFETMFIGEERRGGPELDLQKIRDHFNRNPGSVLVVDGYFQYDTNFLQDNFDYGSKFIKYISISVETENTYFQKLIKEYMNQVKEILKGYLIGVHIRRGDYLQHHADPTLPYFYTMNLDTCINEITNFIHLNRISNPIIYVASDDIDYCQNYFDAKNIRIVTRKNLIQTNASNELNELMVDMASLVCSNALVLSNSSLSLICSLLNTTAKVFLKQKVDGNFTSFDPTNTPILFGL
jgi:hypothetical protein